MKSFCYLGDRLNASGGSEVTVTARTRSGWIKFRECEELRTGRKLSLKMKKTNLLKLCNVTNVWKQHMVSVEE